MYGVVVGLPAIIGLPFLPLAVADGKHNLVTLALAVAVVPALRASAA